MSSIVRRAFALLSLAGAVGASLALPAIFDDSQPVRRAALPVFPDAGATRTFVSLPAPGVAKRPHLAVRAPLAALRRSSPQVHVAVDVPPAVAVTPAPPVVASPEPPPAAPAPPPTPAVSTVSIDQTAGKVVASTPDVPLPVTDSGVGSDQGGGNDDAEGDRGGGKRGDEGERGGAGKKRDKGR